MMTKYFFIFQICNIIQVFFSRALRIQIWPTDVKRLESKERNGNWTERGKDVTERDRTWINAKFQSRLILSHSLQARCILSRFVPYNQVPSYLVPSLLFFLISSWSVLSPVIPNSPAPNCPVLLHPLLSHLGPSRSFPYYTFPSSYRLLVQFHWVQRYPVQDRIEWNWGGRPDGIY